MDNLFYIVGGYGIFWALVLGYLWTLHSRQRQLTRERELLQDTEQP